MKKLFWSLAVVPLVLLVLSIGISGYYIYSLPFKWRLDCATGASPYLFLSPACRAYTKIIYTGDTPESRKKMSTGLVRLMSIYEGNQNSAIGDRSLALADLFIERGADVNFVDERGQTPLHAAVYYGNTDLIKFLLHYGANPNKRTFITFNGNTLSPLELAKEIEEAGKYGGVDWKGIIALLEKSSQGEPLSTQTKTLSSSDSKD